MKKTRSSPWCLVAAVAVVALDGCGGRATVEDQQPSALVPYQTTCLKMGLAANTDEYARCVVALHQRDAERKSVMQEATRDKRVSEGTATPEGVQTAN